jgi:uncharacterized coiled-coil protein SlyX
VAIFITTGGFGPHSTHGRDEMTEIDDLKSKVAKQRNEIARLTQKVAELAADKLKMHRDMLVLKQQMKERNDA